MKRTILLATAITLFTGCAVNNYTSADGTKLKQFIFLQKASVDGLRVSPKTGLSIKATDTETQTEAIAAMTEAAVRGAVKGVKP